MKRILIMFLGLLFIATNVFASGDLVVNGQLAVGAATGGLPKAMIVSTNQRGLSVGVTSTTNNQNNMMLGSSYSVTIDGSVSEDNIIGQKATLNMKSDFSGTVPGGRAAEYTFQIGTPDSVGTTNVAEVIGLKYILNRHYLNTRTYNITNSYGFLSQIQQGGPYNQAINVTNHYHQFLDDPGALSKINMTNLYGMYIEKMTLATNNYGLVLDGDGGIGDYGAAIILGASQNAYLYGKADGVYVYDGIAETKISPHDPETGEWIYYSKNIKTGKTVRVNMEKLVKAVERLTGETFMVETLVEDK